MSKDPVLDAQKDAVLDWHLSSNLYPPATSIPNYMEFAKKAIELVSSGRGDVAVVVTVGDKEGSLVNRKTDKLVTAKEIVDNWRLDDFCGSEETEQSDATELGKLGNSYNN